jgi:hypothetical protein
MQTPAGQKSACDLSGRAPVNPACDLLEGPDRPGFVIVHVENGVQLGDLQKVFHPLG